MTNLDFDAFIRERDEALLSLDREKIEAYMRKYECPIARNDELFWAGVHKARTAISTFPEDERKKSREWLAERGLQHMGDEQ